MRFELRYTVAGKHYSKVFNTRAAAEWFRVNCTSATTWEIKTIPTKG